MLKSDPDNERLLRLLSQGYASYALAYLKRKTNVRAKDFYLRRVTSGTASCAGMPGLQGLLPARSTT